MVLDFIDGSGTAVNPTLPPALQQRQRERALRLEAAKKRIAKEYEETQVTTKVRDLYQLYKDWGTPNKATMAKRLPADQTRFTVPELELLPWIEGDRRVDAATVTRIIYGVETGKVTELAQQLEHDKKKRKQQQEEEEQQPTKPGNRRKRSHSKSRKNRNKSLPKSKPTSTRSGGTHSGSSNESEKKKKKKDKNTNNDKSSSNNNNMDPETSVSSMKVGEIKKKLQAHGIATGAFLEKSEMVEALEKKQREEADTTRTEKGNLNNNVPSSSHVSTMKVGDLKKELEARGIATGAFLEKREMAAALEKKQQEEAATRTEEHNLNNAPSAPGVSTMKVGELKKELEARGIATGAFLEKREMAEALEKKQQEEEATARIKQTTATPATTTTAIPMEERNLNKNEPLPDVSSMRVSALKKELEARGITTEAFLEKSEMAAALEKKKQEEATARIKESKATPATTATAIPTEKHNLNNKAPLPDISTMRVSALKTELEARGIATEAFLEKTEMAQALTTARGGEQSKQSKQRSKTPTKSRRSKTPNKSRPSKSPVKSPRSKTPSKSRPSKTPTKSPHSPSKSPKKKKKKTATTKSPHSKSKQSRNNKASTKDGSSSSVSDQAQQQQLPAVPLVGNDDIDSTTRTSHVAPMPTKNSKLDTSSSTVTTAASTVHSTKKITFSPSEQQQQRKAGGFMTTKRPTKRRSLSLLGRSDHVLTRRSMMTQQRQTDSDDEDEDQHVYPFLSLSTHSKHLMNHLRRVAAEERAAAAEGAAAEESEYTSGEDDDMASFFEETTTDYEDFSQSYGHSTGRTGEYVIREVPAARPATN